VRACQARSTTDLRALTRLRRFLRASRPDILHALLFHANIAARLVGPSAGIPVARILCEIQTVEVERRWHLVVDNLTCRLCRCEIGNSPSVLAHLHRSAHIPLSRLACLWGAVDLAAITAAPPASRPELGLPEDEPVILWAGRLDPVKGFEQMLAAFAAVCRERPARFVLAGEGAYRPVVERLIRDHGLSDRVLLLGQRPDVPSLLKIADVFLFCSRTEGLPNALLEAMAAGLPVVATDVPGCRDVIANGVTGLLVPLGSVDATCRAVRSLLADPELRRGLGRRAREWTAAHLDVADLGTRWEQLYRRIALGDRIQ
jgi:glycosyltransferase involved in cell wall biosynthesis